jgi:hypothetical protein
MAYLNPQNLTESTAITNLICSACQQDIEIGNDCFIDTTAGIEEHKAIIYCSNCAEIIR